MASSWPRSQARTHPGHGAACLAALPEHLAMEAGSQSRGGDGKKGDDALAGWSLDPLSGLFPRHRASL